MTKSWRKSTSRSTKYRLNSSIALPFPIQGYGFKENEHNGYGLIVKLEEKSKPISKSFNQRVKRYV
ncbi:MAG: hypothetical protein IJ915_07525 [Paludibacteraceae bacterium]|nr:hypothetical protein [Paludibacteraceae bacterium]